MERGQFIIEQGSYRIEQRQIGTGAHLIVLHLKSEPAHAHGGGGGSQLAGWGVDRLVACRRLEDLQPRKEGSCDSCECHVTIMGVSCDYHGSVM